MAAPAPTTRDEAKRTLESLYGLNAEWLDALFERFGYDCLTDDALVWVAQQQHAREEAR